MNAPTSAKEALGQHRKMDGLTVTLIYTAFAGLWILLSDRAVTWLFSDPYQVLMASTLKGLLFVAVTALLLYRLMNRLGGATVAATAVKGLGWPIAALALMVVGVTAAVVQQTLAQHEARELARLQAIADLKVGQIDDWLKERGKDAELVQRGSLDALFDRPSRDGGNGASGEAFRNQLETLAKHRDFAAVTVLDSNGRRLWGLPGAPAELAPAVLEAARLAQADGRIARVGPYLGLTGHPRLDYLAPLSSRSPSRSGADSAGEAALLVLHADPVGWLYVFRQAWPVPSASGETLLFRRDGKDVLFLSELRHRKDSALKVRMPLAGSDLLAAKVLNGEADPREVVRGRDYRDVAVIGVVRAVPGTDWYLVAKMDQAELYGEAIEDAARMGVAGLLVLVVLGAAVLTLRQREQLSLAEAARQSQEERLRALKLLTAIADGSEDAIYAKDLEGRFILFNRAACRFAGKTVEEVLGRDERALFSPEQAEALMAVDQQVMREDRASTREITVDTPTGTRILLATKGPLHDAAGGVNGLYGISRDITDSKQAELALRASERRFRDIVDASADWIWEVDPEGRLTYTSDSAESLLGYTPAEMIGRTPFDFMSPEEAQRLRADFAAIVARRVPFRDMEHVNVHKDGSLRHVSSSGMPIFDTDGTLLGYRGLGRDVSAGKLAQRALQETSEHLRTLVNTIPDLVWLKDPNGVYLNCNPRFEALFGAREADIVGKTDHDFVPADLADFFRAKDRAAMAAGVPSVNEEELTYASDGHRELVQTIKTPIYDSAGRIIGVLGIARDITALKAATEALRARERYIRALFDNFPFMVWLKDRDGRFLAANQVVARIANVANPDEMIGKTDLDFWGPDLANHYREDDLAVLESGKPATVEEEITEPGRRFWIETYKSPVQLDGQVIGTVGYARDITERKAAEEELHRYNEELRRFNRATVGRELDMLELKKRVNALSRELGREPPFPLAFLDEDSGKATS